MIREHCLHCGKKPTNEGHDPCVANLPEVVFACCGHGGEGGFSGREDWSVPYLVERERKTLYGYPAIDRMRELGGNPPDFNAALVIERAGMTDEDAARWGCTSEGAKA